MFLIFFFEKMGYGIKKSIVVIVLIFTPNLAWKTRQSEPCYRPGKLY